MLGGRSSLFIVSEIVYFIIIFIFYTDMSNKNFYCYMSNLTSFMLKELLVSFMWQEGGRNNQGQGWVRINQDQGQGWVWGWENIIPEAITNPYWSVNWFVCQNQDSRSIIENGSTGHILLGGWYGGLRLNVYAFLWDSLQLTFLWGCFDEAEVLFGACVIPGAYTLFYLVYTCFCQIHYIWYFCGDA